MEQPGSSTGSTWAAQPETVEQTSIKFGEASHSGDTEPSFGLSQKAGMRTMLQLLSQTQSGAALDPDKEKALGEGLTKLLEKVIDKMGLEAIPQLSDFE